jgi:hypothetical protein
MQAIQDGDGFSVHEEGDEDVVQDAVRDATVWNKYTRNCGAGAHGCEHVLLLLGSKIGRINRGRSSYVPSSEGLSPCKKCK